MFIETAIGSHLPLRRSGMSPRWGSEVVGVVIFYKHAARIGLSGDSYRNLLNFRPMAELA
jgi:hypothetical protein